MTLSLTLSIVGPAFTTFGAALLTYDVLRGPARFLLEVQHTERLDAAEHDRKHAVRSLKATVNQRTTGEQRVEVAENAAHHAEVVRDEETTHADAGASERARTFRLGVWGLVLVGVGGIAQTVAALLVAVDKLH